MKDNLHWKRFEPFNVPTVIIAVKKKVDTPLLTASKMWAELPLIVRLFNDVIDHHLKDT